MDDIATLSVFIFMLFLWGCAGAMTKDKFKTTDYLVLVILSSVCTFLIYCLDVVSRFLMGV